MPKTLRGLIRNTVPAYGSVFFISFFLNLLILAPPIYLLQVHERVYTSQSLVTLGFLTAIVAFLLVVAAFLAWARSEICSRVSFSFVDEIEEDVFRGNLTQPTGSISSNRYAADLNLIRETLGGPFVPAVFDVAFSPIFIAVLFLLHPAFGFLGIGLIVLLGGLSFANHHFNRDVIRKAQESQASVLELSGLLSRSTDAARSMGMVPGLGRVWKGRQATSRGWQAAAQRRTAPIVSVTRFLRTSQLVLVTMIGAILYIDGAISAGASFGAMIILMRSIGPIETVIGGWRNLTGARDAFDRLETLISNDGRASDRVILPRPEGDLALSGVSIAANENKEVIVHNVTFTLGHGNILAVIGPSGAGKSTLLRGLAGVLPLAQGKMTLDGHAFHHWQPDELGRFIGYLPQDTELFPGTVAENITRFYSDVSKDDPRLFEALEMSGTTDLVKSLPEGLNTMIGPRGYQLSGGQRQRLAFARAVFGGPSLILLDEPYSALDSKDEAHLVRSLSALAAGGSTVVLVTHKLNMLSHCDMVLVMQSGFVQAFGARDMIMQRLPQTQPVPLRLVDGG
ncbi:MAG: ATP-binding cassette domain-containing protein [Aurantimonas endophytica]|uniref:type I secretion system permease/ATPase n=1 Tax=Aurantimonas endophytica TaxID=1522175 RepID=UPI00300383C7